jgi:hypothetical protein
MVNSPPGIQTLRGQHKAPGRLLATRSFPLGQTQLSVQFRVRIGQSRDWHWSRAFVCRELRSVIRPRFRQLPERRGYPGLSSRLT